MTDNLKGIEQATQLATTEEAQIHGSPQRNGLILSAGIFVIALVAALLQNTRKPVQELAMLFDSGAYVMSTKYVLTAAQNFMHGMPFESALKSVSETLMLNGPVLPVLGATYFAAIAKEPSLIDMRAPIVLQAVIHATAATTLALAGWRLTGGRKLGLTAGLILAVWPSAVIGAGRFLTETITTLFISAVMLSASYLPKRRTEDRLRLSRAAAFFFGLTTGLLVLTKAALAPAVVLTLVAVFVLILLAKVERSSFITAVLSAVMGALLVIAPWLIFTKIASGEFCLTPKRLPTFNMAAGLNPETDGFSALPETPLVMMFSENDGPGAAAYAFYNLNPGDFYGRMARKPLRLFQYPWNDCRLDFLGIPVALQVITHQVLVVFGFFGLLAFMCLPMSFGPKAEKNRDARDVPSQSISEQPHPELNPAISRNAGSQFEIEPAAAEPGTLSSLLIGIVALMILFGHAAYLPFVADSRYGFTAIPSLILFALWCLSGQRHKRINKTSLIRLGIAAIFIIVAFTLKDTLWRSLFATSTEAMLASTLSLGALFLFIGCMMAVRTLLGTGKSNTTAKVLALLTSYLTLTIVLAASLMGKESPYDWEAKLTDKEELIRIIDLPQSASVENAYILANLKGDWKAARLKINEELIDSEPISLLHLTDNPSLSNDYRTFGYILKTGTDGIAQWRAFKVPNGLLRQGAQNTIALSADKGEARLVGLTGCTVFGGSKRSAAAYTAAPSVNLFSPTNLCRSPLSMEPRLREKLPKSVAGATCIRKSQDIAQKDLSSEPGTQLGQYHIFLLAGGNSAQSEKQVADPIYVDVKPSSKQSSSGNKQIDSVSNYFGDCILPEKAFTASHLRLKLSGEIDCASAVNLQISLNDLRLMQAPVDLACHPSKAGGVGKRPFKTQAIVLSSAIDPKSALAMIKISSDLVPLTVSNLRLELKPLAAPELNLSRKSWY